MTPGTEATRNRREFFPRGMVQPEGGYRFSLDSLLLACYAKPGPRHVGVDLGCGCGVIGFGMLLRQPDLTLIGVEKNADSVEAASLNSNELGMTDNFSVVQGDVAAWRPEKVVDFVVSNPPYRQLGRGRASEGEGRMAARFEGESDFHTFARCAAIALKTKGKFTFVHLPERLPELMDGLRQANLAPKRMRLVHARMGGDARMVLMEAVKAGGPGLKVEPPLFLHDGRGKSTRLTAEALEFCPFLGCNPSLEGDAE